MVNSLMPFCRRHVCPPSPRRVGLVLLLITCHFLSTTAKAPETMQEVEERLLKGYSRNCHPTLAEAQLTGKREGTCGVKHKPNKIEVQIFVHRLRDVNQRMGSFHIEGYFRMWWLDPRLKFNGTKDGGCEDKLHYTLDPNTPPPLWVPDIYFENAQRNDLGMPNDGMLLESYPSGEVFMVQRMRVTVNCEMALHRLPWDKQTCGINVGVFSETTRDVQLVWTSKNKDGALANLLNQSLSEWKITHPIAKVAVHKGAGGDYSLLIANFVLERHAGHYQMILIKSCIFVFISYLGCWIDPHAAPARVTLAILMILIVITKIESVESELPPVGYHVWLVDFQTGCLVFNILAFFIYVLVNVGLQYEAKLKTLKKDHERSGPTTFEHSGPERSFPPPHLSRPAPHRLQTHHPLDGYRVQSRWHEFSQPLPELRGDLCYVDEVSSRWMRVDHGGVPGWEPQERDSYPSPNLHHGSPGMRAFGGEDGWQTLQKGYEFRREHWRLSVARWLAKLKDLDDIMHFLFPLSFGIFVGIMFATLHSYQGNENLAGNGHGAGPSGSIIPGTGI